MEVNINAPERNAVPSTTESTVSASRSLWAATFRSDTVAIGEAIYPSMADMTRRIVSMSGRASESTMLPSRRKITRSA